jgi:hypothetical protein
VTPAQRYTLASGLSRQPGRRAVTRWWWPFVLVAVYGGGCATAALWPMVMP